MKLSDRIKQQRVRCGLSQEKVAELVDVSRQAVTKWESGQSAPSTENLFKLAEIFGTTVDLLLPREDPAPEPEKPPKPIDAAGALMAIAGYLAIYLLGRILWTDEQVFSFGEWLFGYEVDRFAYLYGWLLHHHGFWYCMALSVLAGLLGKRRFAWTTTGAFGLGLVLGELLGANPAGASWGQGHYGAFIWLGIFLFSIPMGIWLEQQGNSGQDFRSRCFRVWLLCALAGTAAIVIFTRLSFLTHHAS